MNDSLRLFLLSWEFRPDVTLILLLAGILYGRGWYRLRRRGRGQGANGWRLAAYLSGLFAIALALLSPIDVFQSVLFFMHMIQHLLLVMVAPPLLLLANPMPFVLWGLPRQLRRRLGLLFRPSAPLRRALRRSTTPGISWATFIAILIGWHDPNAYNASLRYGWLHDIEHLTFFFSGMLYWWHVVGAAPRLHKPLPFAMRLIYLIGAVPFNMLLGVAIAFATQPIYTYYLSVPRVWGISALNDQQIGGAIMWIPGSMMYLLAVLVIVSRFASADSDRPGRITRPVQASKPMSSAESR